MVTKMKKKLLPTKLKKGTKKKILSKSKVQTELEVPEFSTVGMKLITLNWDKEYEKDIENGIGFDIDDTAGIVKTNGKYTKSLKGIYSPMYGTDISEEVDISNWTCKCKAMKGKFYDDGVTKCEKCGYLITYNNTSMEKTGWITLRSDIHLINPLYYHMLEKVIGKKHLNNIIYYNKECDEDGNVLVNLDYYDENNPYYSIGLIEFYNRFDEILDYYKDNIKGGTPQLKQEKMEIYEFVKNNKENVFCNHFPVYTLLLRPILMIKNNMVFDPINTKYQSLLVNVDDLNKTDTTVDRKDLKVLPLLYQSQIILNKIHKITIDNQISKKEGHIRASMLGERVNFSSRCVIIPLIGRYGLDEIKLPYLVFLELYKYEIINLLCKMDKITINEAIKRWNKAIEKFDRRIYLIMKYIIDNTNGGCWCFINRNPSLNYGSMLTMRIVDVKEDYDDLTLSIPLNVLGLLAGDFDGDVLNIISIKTQEFREHYNSIFNPRLMMIDRNNGRFNRSMNLIKDQMIGLFSFCKE